MNDHQGLARALDVAAWVIPFRDLEEHMAAARDGRLLEADDLGAPPRWRLAWALHGLPHPLPVSEYRTAFSRFEDRYGVAELVAGLDLAAGIPAAHGRGVDVARFASLADAYRRRRPS